jgi:hypothetical protein
MNVTPLMKTIWQKIVRKQIQKLMAGQVFWKPAMIFFSRAVLVWSDSRNILLMPANGILFGEK